MTNRNDIEGRTLCQLMKESGLDNLAFTAPFPILLGIALAIRPSEFIRILANGLISISTIFALVSIAIILFGILIGFVGGVDVQSSKLKRNLVRAFVYEPARRAHEIFELLFFILFGFIATSAIQEKSICGLGPELVQLFGALMGGIACAGFRALSSGDLAEKYAQKRATRPAVWAITVGAFIIVSILYTDVF